MSTAQLSIRWDIGFGRDVRRDVCVCVCVCVVCLCVNVEGRLL